MALRKELLFAVLLTVIVAVQAQQGCDMSLLTDPDALKASLISTQAVSGAGDGAGPPSDLTIYDQHVVCLVTTNTRDQYQYASVVVVFSCTGTTAANSLLGTTCKPDNYTSQFDFECRGSSGSMTWQESLTPLSLGSGSALNFFINSSADFTTELDSFCSLCVDPDRNIPDAVTPLPIDPITHCASCDSSCLTSPDGQELCYGITPSQCCNVFEDNMCELQCSVGSAPKLQPDGKTLVCEPVCEDLSNPTDGSVGYDPTGPHFLGTVATYSCVVGYTLGSPSSVTCGEGAEQSSVLWSTSTPPNCTIIDCGEEGLTENGLGDFSNGQVDIPSPTTFGAVATYSCDDNYVLNGNEQRTCEVGGWSGAIPECVSTCVPMCVNGVCNDNQCDCDDGFEGDLCDLITCVPSCQNGGICNNGVCECVGDYTGDDCSECSLEPDTFLPKNCTPCDKVFGVDCKECDDDKCTVCTSGRELVDGKCIEGEKSGEGSGGGCGVGCIVGIVIAAIILAALLAALIAAIIFGIYKYKISPATKLKKLEGEGLNGVARDNPLYVDPSTVEEEVETGGEATGL